MLSSSKVLLFCLLCISAAVVYGFDPPEPQVRFLQRGFEVSVPAKPGMTIFAFHGNKNRALNGVSAGTWNEDIRYPVNGRFTYVNHDTKFNAGDKLHFWTHVVHNGLGYNRLGLVKSPGGGGGGRDDEDSNSHSVSIEDSFNTHINFRDLHIHHGKKK